MANRLFARSCRREVFNRHALQREWGELRGIQCYTDKFPWTFCTDHEPRLATRARNFTLILWVAAENLTLIAQVSPPGAAAPLGQDLQTLGPGPVKLKESAWPHPSVCGK